MSSRWPPARARRCPARSPPPATRSQAGASTSSPSTTTWPSATPSGWARCCEAMGLTVGWVTADSTADERRAAYEVRRHLRVGQRDRLRRAARPARHRRRRPGVAEPGRGADRRGRLGARRRGAGAAGAGRHVAPGDAEARNHPAGRRVGRGRRTTTPTPTGRNVHLTETGAQKVEAKLGGIDLYSEEHVGTTLTEVNVALHAHVLLHRDVALHRPRRRRAPDQRLPRPHRARCSAGRTGCRPPSRPRRASRPPRPARCSTPSPCRR